MEKRSWIYRRSTEKKKYCLKKGFAESLLSASAFSPPLPFSLYSRTRSLARRAANAPQLSNMRSPILKKVSCDKQEALSTRAEAAASSYRWSAFSPASGTPPASLEEDEPEEPLLLPATDAAATTWSSKA